MFTAPLITLAALLLTQKTSCELLAKEQDLVNHGIIKKSHKKAMFSSAFLGNQRRPKEKDVVADFVLMRRLDEHQVCRSIFQSRFPPNLYCASVGISSSDEEESRPFARHVSQALAQVQSAAKKENETSLGSE